MPKPRNSLDVPLRGTGIFGPDWPKWRGAVLEVTLDDEPPFLARLDTVLYHPHTTPPSRQASLTLLDRSLKPTGVRALPWPPSGSVRVIRTP